MGNAIVNTERNATRRKIFLLTFNWCFIKNERFSCHELLIAYLFLFWNLFLWLIWLWIDRLCAQRVYEHTVCLMNNMDLSIQNAQLLNDRTGKNNYTHHQRKSIWSEQDERIRENKKNCSQIDLCTRIKHSQCGNGNWMKPLSTFFVDIHVEHR